MPFYCLCCVIRTTGIKTTILPEKRTHSQLVCLDQQEQWCFHHQSREDIGGFTKNANRRSSSFRSSRFRLACVAGCCLVLTGWDRRTTQSVAGKADKRNVSRTRRLMVLRVTARGARRFATTTPNLACDLSVRREYSTKCAVRKTGRKRKTDEKSSVFTIR